MPESNERSVSPSNEVWRLVASEIDCRSITPSGRATLRLWAGEQMRDMPARVWRRRGGSGGLEVRTSFVLALKQAARDVVAGKPLA